MSYTYVCIGYVREERLAGSYIKTTSTDDNHIKTTPNDDNNVNQDVGVLQELLYVNYKKDVKPTRYADEEMNITFLFKMSNGLVRNT